MFEIVTFDIVIDGCPENLNVGVDVNNYKPIPMPKGQIVLCGHVHESSLQLSHS